MLILSLTACVQPIEIDVDQEGAGQLVLSGVLEVNDSLADVLRITSSVGTSLSDVEVPEVRIIHFYQNGELVGRTETDPLGYVSVPPHYPVAGSTYEVVVELIDGSIVSCNGIAPTQVDFEGITWAQDGTQDRDGNQLFQFTLNIHDPGGEAQYYEMVFPRIQEDYDVEDSLFVAGYRYTLFRPNEVMANEGDQDFNPKSLFFSDELFDGTTYTFEQYFDGSDGGGAFGTQGNYGINEAGLHLLLRSTDNHYYDFLKSWTRHRYTSDLARDFAMDELTVEYIQDLLFAPQPTPLISNVTGGLGVVGAVHTQVIRIP